MTDADLEAKVAAEYAEHLASEEARHLYEQRIATLEAERAELKKLARNVRDYWAAERSGKPPGTPDGISTPGMMLLLLIEALK